MAAVEELLDLAGIDAVLSRFRARRAEDQVRVQKTQSWEADQPSILRPEALKALHLRFRAVAEKLSTEMTATMRASVRINLRRLDTPRFRTLLESMPERTALFMLDVAELPMPGFMRFDAETVTSMIDRLLGGRGQPSELTRDLTQIDQRVVRDIIHLLIGQHQSILSSIKPLTIKWSKTICASEELRPFPHAEVFVAADYDISVEGGTTWKFQFALPLGNLVAPLEAVSALPVKQQENRDERRARMQKSLAGVRVQCSVKIGDAGLTLDDVLHLAPGDVIVLDRRRGDTLDFLVEDATKYHGKLGQRDNALMFQVIDAKRDGV